MIILCHSSGYWFDPEWKFLHGIVYMWLDVFGPSLFIFLSALSVVFSINKKKGKVPDNVIRNNIFSRGILIMIVGSLYTIASNIMWLPNISFPFNLYGWNILTFIGLSQIIAYYALKISEPSRIFIGFIIILFSPTLRSMLIETILIERGVNPATWWIDMNVDVYTQGCAPQLLTSNYDIFRSFSSFSYFALFSPTPHSPPFPWAAICLISSMWGEWLAAAMKKGTRRAYKAFNKRILLWGMLLVGTALLFGSELMTEETARLEYIDVGLYTMSNQQSITYFPGVFRFLIHGEMSNTIYLMGAALLILALFFYLVDIRQIQNKLTDMLSYYGKTSLSLFLIHYILFFFFPNSMNLLFYIFAVIGYWAFLGFLMYVWIEFGDGKGSPEWIIIQMGRTGDKAEKKIKEGIEKRKVEQVEREVEPIKAQ